MSDSRENSIIEEMERYRRNNVELAVALNELKTELNIAQMQMLDQKRELQKVYDENAMLKQNIIQKDVQLNTWRALIVDLVTTNTKKYTEMMQRIGLVPAANNGTINSTTNAIVKHTTKIEKSTEQSNKHVNVQRRPRFDDNNSPPHLADLTEESIQHSEINESRSYTPSPEKIVTHVTSRRRVSISPMTPASPLRVIQERLVGSGESKTKKSAGKLQKIDKIIDENTQVNGTACTFNGRSQRRAAPRNLSEPKLRTKLRRN